MLAYTICFHYIREKLKVEREIDQNENQNNYKQSKKETLDERQSPRSHEQYPYNKQHAVCAKQQLMLTQRM